MDLSKLPKLSQSPAPPAEESTTPDPSAPAPSPVAQSNPAAYAPVRPSSSVAEAWISIAIGLIVLLMVPYTLQYASSKLFHTTFEPFPDPTRPFPAKCDFLLFNDGTKIFYRNTQNFLSDLVVTGFALVLIVDGLVLLWARNRTFVAFAFCLTIVATAANLLYLVTSYSQYGLATLSALAVVFGGYIAIHQWNLLQSMRRLRA